MPALRNCLDGAVREITQTKDDLVPLVGRWDLPDDHEEAVALLRGRARRALE